LNIFLSINLVLILFITIIIILFIINFGIFPEIPFLIHFRKFLVIEFKFAILSFLFYNFPIIVILSEINFQVIRFFRSNHLKFFSTILYSIFGIRFQFPIGQAYFQIVGPYLNDYRLNLLLFLWYKSQVLLAPLFYSLYYQYHRLIFKFHL